MDVNKKKEKLINKEISVYDLSSKEVEEIKEIVEKELEDKKNDLNNLNKKIKDMKVRIDNWQN